MKGVWLKGLCLFVLAAGPLFGADEGLSLSVSPNPLGIRDDFYVVLLVDHENRYEVEVDAPESPAFYIRRGPYTRTVFESDSTGAVERKTRITYTLRTRRLGRYEIPPFRVKAGEKSWQTEPFLLEIGYYRDGQLKLPLEPRWQLGSGDEAFVGQNIPVVLWLRRQPSLILTDDITVTPPASGFFEEAPVLDEIKEYTLAGRTLYDIPVAAYTFTPTVPGRQRIPGAAVFHSGRRGDAPPVDVAVSAQPEALRESGALGRFSVDAALSGEVIPLGGDIVLSVTVSGEGNLNFLSFPEPQSSVPLREERVEESFSATAGGLRGSKTFIYRYAAGEDGTLAFSVPSFAFLDPAEGRVNRTAPISLSCRVEAAPEAENPAAVFPFALIPFGDYERYRAPEFWESPAVFLLLLPGLAGSFLLLTWRRTGPAARLGLLLTLLLLGSLPLTARLTENYGLKGFAAYEEGHYRRAWNHFRSAAAEDPADTALLYNSAVSAYRGGERALAFRDLRRALNYLPANRLYRRTLTWMEANAGVSDSIDTPFPFPLWILSLVALVFGNGAALLGAMGRRRGGGFTIASILSVLVLVLSLLFFGYLHGQSRETAVVVKGGETVLRKIPEETAASWLTLKEGVALRCLDQVEGYYLVKTSYGVTGWVEKLDVYLCRREK